MPRAAEYRAWAEESLRWARDAMTESTRDAYTKLAQFWLESASRSERLSPQIALEHEQPLGIEHRVVPISVKHGEVFASQGNRVAAPIPGRGRQRRRLH
jgi:hypothetical protein